MFGFCINHILNTECAKIWNKIRRQKVNVLMCISVVHSYSLEREWLRLTGQIIMNSHILHFRIQTFSKSFLFVFKWHIPGCTRQSVYVLNTPSWKNTIINCQLLLVPAFYSGRQQNMRHWEIKSNNIVVLMWKLDGISNNHCKLLMVLLRDLVFNK